MYKPTWREIPQKRAGYSMVRCVGIAACCLAFFLVLYGIAEAATDEPVEWDICKEAFAYDPGDREQPETVEIASLSDEPVRRTAKKERIPDIPEEPRIVLDGEDEVEPEEGTWTDTEPVYDIYWDEDDGSEYYEPVYEEVYGEETDGAEDSGDDIGVSGYYTADEFRFDGRVYDGDHEYTWYSEQVLPGGGLDIPGRHVDEDGYVRDGDGNLCVASNGYSYGEQIEVPFGDGTAVVYDSCEGEGDELVDVYVSW